MQCKYVLCDVFGIDCNFAYVTSCLLQPIVELMAGYRLGGQKIGEANSDDISLWCHLHWC